MSDNNIGIYSDNRGSTNIFKIKPFKKWIGYILLLQTL
jgi:hypothetical protein